MYIGKRYSLANLLMWTRWELLGFLLYSLTITYLYEGRGYHFLYVPWTPVALIGTAVAFLIGFQHNAAYGRAWEARKIWGGIVNSSRTWAMKVHDMVRPLKNESEDRNSMKEIHSVIINRHIAWLTALRHQLRQPRKWESNMDHVTNREWSNNICIPERANSLQKDITQYLPLSELDYVMSKDNKATAILFLQSRHVRKLKELGHIWEWAFLNLEDVLEELFTLQGQSERIKNFPYPRQYATISHWFIWMFLLLIPFGIVPEFERIGQELDKLIPGTAHYFAWGSIPFCTSVSWVFHTMERIGRAGENPFEGSPNDVPISNIARSIEIDILQQMNMDLNKIPKPFPSINNVQM